MKQFLILWAIVFVLITSLVQYGVLLGILGWYKHILLPEEFGILAGISLVSSMLIYSGIINKK